MSDSTEDLVKEYKENVSREEHPRSIGLFTIPEYPELEVDRGMWSSALDAILTTLRYLAPATLLTLFWGQQSFLFRILKHIDSALRSIVFSSEEQKQASLQWLAEAGPVKVEHLDTVWRHGWVLCGAIDAALPGACAGHPPTTLSLKHAQTIADHYLGVEPVFSHQELESNDSLSRHQEWKLAAYLDRIRQALSKITPPVSKPVPQRTSPETNQFILDYAAKGSGLSAVQINNKAHFKIYPTAQQCLDPGDVTILIRGPKDTYGMTVLPPIFGKAQLIRHKLLGLHLKQSYTENVLPITQGATYLRNFGKNDMNKTYYIPKSQYDIEIDVDRKSDHAKISYTVKLEGNYLVSITSRGHSILGSPFSVTASNNIIQVLEKDSFYLEDGEEIDIVDVHTDRKVVLRIVDFVTEKMLLNENGTLEKISDDEAKRLMMIDKGKGIQNFERDLGDETLNTKCEKSPKHQRFKKASYKILILGKVCKVFNNLIKEKQMNIRNERIETATFPRTQQDIPDIVNSTLTETNACPYVMPGSQEKIIVPQSLSVSLKAEVSKSCYADMVENASDDGNILVDNPVEMSRVNTPDSIEIKNAAPDQLDDNISDRGVPLITANNPFLSEMFEENYVAANNFGTFVASEYETNNSQNEETRDSSITIIIDSNVTQSPVKAVSPSPVNNNPFIESNMLDFERPKTPVFKIISGEKVNRDESVFIDPKVELIPEEELGNEFVNPFFMNQFESRHFDHAPTADFIIGAPVSLPPIIRAASPEPEMKALIMTESDNENTVSRESSKKYPKHESVYLTPLHNNPTTPTDNKKGNSVISSTFHSLDFSLSETIDNSNASTTSDSQFEPDQSDSDRNITPRKDIWDSAYVSIDDTNSSPDNNNNENTILYETFGKQKFPNSDEIIELKQEEIPNMGPAEREIWQTCNDLKCDLSKVQEDVRQYKWEIKRPTCTPIIEESDRNISSGSKDVSKYEITTKPRETDTVSVAFAELNDMYQEYFPNSETINSPVTDEDNKLHSMEVEYITQTKDISVNSASEILDVKRHNEEIEGTISEVQANATESVSVSQTLHNDHLKYENKNKIETQFGENHCNSIVLEKKKYWDERIREIEAKSQISTIIPKKRRNSSKQLKHDSLSKRKGKQMVKNFLSTGDYSQVKDVNQEMDKSPSYKRLELEDSQNDRKDSVNSDITIVKKWKKFWDEKLESDQIQAEAEALKIKSPKKNVPSQILMSNQIENQTIAKVKIHDTKDYNEDNKKIANKQELPEEIFKAFETSPKRFFGTSRKQIMNKIDTFLGKPTEINSSTTDIAMCHESGLVSSRISLFHNISNTEELPWSRKKCQSLQNISQRREGEKKMTFMDYSQSVEETEVYERKDLPNKYPAVNDTKTEAINTNVTEATDLKTKRSKMMQNAYHKTLDETICEKPLQQINRQIQKEYVKRTNKDGILRDQSTMPKLDILQKKSFSKSEMDIFNKVATDTGDALDKYKSYDELPKINVKSFISLYENVSKTTEKPKPAKRVFRTSSADSQKTQSDSTSSTTSNAVSMYTFSAEQVSISNNESKYTTPRVTPTNLWKSKTSETVSNLSLDTKTSDSYDVENFTKDNKETTYLSLSDIELEIIESGPDKLSIESTPEKKVEHIEYKNRFKLAKKFFQSLEELTDVKKPRKLNECELLLRKESTESLEEEQTNKRPQKRVKKNIKSHSLPSSEIAKGWNQLKENQIRCASEERSNTRLVKISEKFNVDDLFTDVTEGKLSRQGSLRGIPHKKAVLEAFRSMENIADTTLSSFELLDSQFIDFAGEHIMNNAQTYLKDYPYLPTTDPSKYHSRVDVKASGLISLKELKEKMPRRNSVPDLRLNPSFTANL
ncbi:unnamed protein product [Arctia plantaginis]|uniref:Uncharacterized protein n=1 Tax=Arctia plantaginis TaxID=874455 RepID=A0A8S1B752_ARCPL|nr:unnamed protein product [Arctia plantaginis]